MRILFLNPPSERPAIRDYFCSKISQADYVSHPVDFVCQSGLLAQLGEVSLLDAVVERLGPSECRDRLDRFSPDVVLALTGFATWPADMEFLPSVANGRRIFLIGDALRENPQSFLESHPFVEGVLTDFISDGLARHLRGDDGPLPGLELRGKPASPPLKSSFDFPVPHHELFLGKDYRYPFVLSRRFATVLTEYGCPHHCGFCVMGTLGHRLRSMENVAAELDRLRDLLVRDIFFADQSFGADTGHTGQLLDVLNRHSPKFRWLCFSRPDASAPARIESFRDAGCHTIIFGIETADPELLSRYNKGYSREQIATAFRAASSAGLRTVGTLILGLPGDSEAGFRDSVAFVKSLPCDFLSLNVAVPRPGTALHRDSLASGLIDESPEHMDQSGTVFVLDPPEFPAWVQKRLKRWALREFYLNPAYISRRLRRVRSAEQLRIESRQGLSLLKNFVWNR